MQVRRCWNPLVVDADHEVVAEYTRALSVREVIAHAGLTFARPVVCMVDGQCWSRRDWDHPVPPGAVVRFVELPRGSGGGGSNPLQVIATIALVAASIWMPGALGLVGGWAALGSAAIMAGGSLLMGMMFGGAEQPGGGAGSIGTPDPMYSLAAGGNRLRLGEPYAEHFGRLKAYPDYAQGSFVRIESNEQYLYFLGIVGVGEYAVEGVYVDDTPLADYAGATYAVLPPGTVPGIVAEVCWTSGEVSGQELGTDWLTCTVNPPGTRATAIEYDLVCAGGLIAYNDRGDPVTTSVAVAVRARLVDDDGQALGDWTTLDSRTHSAASKNPRRWSHRLPAPLGPGRYQVGIRRTSAASTSSRVMNRMSVGGLRGYGGAHPAIAGATALECRVKATDQLSSEVASRINVIATRKLRPVTASGLGGSAAATRSIVDAVAYMVTSGNGGRLASGSVAWAELYALRQALESAGRFFDWRFTGRTGVMAAVAQAARLGRAVPAMPGGLFALVQDAVQSVARLAFGGADISEGSLSVSTALRRVDSPTCVRATYVNPATWQAETVTCFDAGGSEDIPHDVTLSGCTSRQHAYALGMYLYRDMTRCTTTVEWTTGLKGHLATLFAKVLVDEALVDWGQSGVIARVEPGLIWTSEPVDFRGAEQGAMYVELADGSVGGPYPVTSSEYAHCVAGALPGDTRTLDAGDVRAARYVFGPVDVEPLLVRVMAIRPRGRDEVAILGQIIDNAVYDPVGAAPPLGSAAPEVAYLQDVSLVPGESGYLALWSGSATAFRVELSEGGGGWVILEDSFAGFSLAVATGAAAFSVRVTPYVAGALSSARAITRSLSVIQAPGGLVVVSATAEATTVAWSALAGASVYRVSLWRGGTERTAADTTATTAQITTQELAAIGGPWPDFEIRVAAVVGGVLGPWATVAVGVAALPAPAGLALVGLLSGGGAFSWGAVEGSTGYKLYYGSTAGFDPAGAGTLVFTGAGTSASVGGLNMTPPYAHYFKVAATSAYHQAPGDLVFSAALAVVDAGE